MSGTLTLTKNQARILFEAVTVALDLNHCSGDVEFDWTERECDQAWALRQRLRKFCARSYTPRFAPEHFAEADRRAGLSL